MVASIADYKKYAYDVPAKQMDTKVFTEIMDPEKRKDLDNLKYKALFDSQFPGTTHLSFRSLA